VSLAHRGRRVLAISAAAAGLAALPAAALAAPPTVTVPVGTTSLTFGVHESLTLPVACSSSDVVGGGSYLRNAMNPATVPNNGLVLDGTMPSDALGGQLANSASNPVNWTTVAGFAGQSETGDESETFAMCETSGGPSGTTLAVATTTGANATQEVNAPTLTTATCSSGRLLGGGAVETTPGQVNDGATSGNTGNLKPLASYPSNSSGTMATNGSTNPTSWTAYGSAGMPASTDVISAFAICDTATTSPTVTVERSDTSGPNAQAGSTVTTATIGGCPASTQLVSGGFEVDETVSSTSGLQPQQGYHLRGSYPSGSTGTEVANAATNPSYWTSVLQAGGQTLATGRHMNTHTFALCSS
jgi:hypothetical protein